LLAGLAALGFVLQTLVMKERLFSGCPNEILVTIYALDAAIWMFGIPRRINFVEFFPFGHD
jgi:hypothetical protein